MGGVWPASGVGALRFSIAAIVLGGILWSREGRAGFHVGRPWLHVARGFAIAWATLAFFSAIFVMPLAEAVTIQFVNPIITALLSGWLLSERMSRAAWIATAVAFTGVLIMLRPNIAEFGWQALLPLFAALGFSSLMILNRMVSSQRSVWAAQYYAAAWAAVLLTAAATVGHWLVPALHIPALPAWDVIARCALVALSASCCHYLLYLSTTRSTAATIAPLVYVQLIVATLISLFFFGDPIDGVSVLGGGLIVGSGLYLWLADQRAAAV